MENAEKGIEELRNHVDTIIIIPNQNLFIVTDPKTTNAEAFSTVDQVLHAGVRAVTDLIIQPGLINLDFADIRTTMSEMGRAVFGTGEASGEKRAIEAQIADNLPLPMDAEMPPIPTLENGIPMPEIAGLPPLNRPVICPDCSSRFEVSTELTVTRCPICALRINL